MILTRKLGEIVYILEVEIVRIYIHPHDAESKNNVYEKCSRVKKFVSIKVSSGLPVHHNYYDRDNYY